MNLCSPSQSSAATGTVTSAAPDDAPNAARRRRRWAALLKIQKIEPEKTRKRTGRKWTRVPIFCLDMDSVGKGSYLPLSGDQVTKRIDRLGGKSLIYLVMMVNLRHSYYLRKFNLNVLILIKRMA